MPTDSSGVVALVVLDTKEAEMRGDASPTEHIVGLIPGVPGHRERWTTINPDSKCVPHVHFITPTEQRRNEHERETQTKPSGVCTAKRVGASPRKHVFVHFIRRSTAHGTWIKPHTMTPELMAPTSCLTLKWKNEEEDEDLEEVEQGEDLALSFSGHIRVMCVSHIM